jgi:hypothetical protein
MDRLRPSGFFVEMIMGIESSSSCVVVTVSLTVATTADFGLSVASTGDPGFVCGGVAEARE